MPRRPSTEMPSILNASAAGPVPSPASTTARCILLMDGPTLSADRPLRAKASCRMRSSPAATPVRLERSESAPARSSAPLIPTANPAAAAAAAANPAATPPNTAGPAAALNLAMPFSADFMPRLNPEVSKVSLVDTVARLFGLQPRLLRGLFLHKLHPLDHGPIPFLHCGFDSALDPVLLP